MADRHTNLADLAAGEFVIGVVGCLGWQIEGNGKARLALPQIGAVEGVGFRRRRMASVGAKQPGFVARRCLTTSAGGSLAAHWQRSFFGAPQRASLTRLRCSAKRDVATRVRCETGRALQHAIVFAGDAIPYPAPRGLVRRNRPEKGPRPSHRTLA